jgi:inner membrane protein
MQDIKFGDLIERTRESLLFRGFILFAIVIALQIPILAIGGLTSEREASRNEAEYNIAQLWGQQQTLRGPFLVIPYEKRWVDKEGTQQLIIDEIVFSPETLGIDATTQTEIRYRGIYELPVYTADVGITGTFNKPDLSSHTINPSQVLWEKARIVFGVSETKSITNSLALKLGEKSINFVPGGGTRFLPNTVSASIGDNPNLWNAAVPFSFHLNFRGSKSLSFHPAGESNKINISSDWGDPSFYGSYLPNSRDISNEGFSSHWEIPFIGRNYPKSWSGNDVTSQNMSDADFGVTLITPVSAYTMSDRALKYEFLFTCLTFMTLLMCEVIGKIRIHPIQYLLVGGALCMFYLLTLSMSEHIGYGIAYIIAASMIVVMNGTYVRSLVGNSRAGILASVMMSLYGFLYVLLTVQDYALLMGSVGLTAILALIMYLTRNIDWYNIGQRNLNKDVPVTN